MIKIFLGQLLVLALFLTLIPHSVLAGGSSSEITFSSTSTQSSNSKSEIYVNPIDIKLSGDLLKAGNRESSLTSIANLIEAISRFAWPVVAIFFLSFYRDSINKILSKITKLKIFGQEVELEEEIEELKQEVQEAKESVPTQDIAEFELNETLVRRKIIEESSRNPVSAIIMLASEIERTAREIMAGSGWLQKEHKLNVRQNFKSLIDKKRVPESVYSSFDLFWQIRNKVVHGVGTRDISQKELMKIIDIGLTLLNTLNAIPRERHYVKATEIDLYSDPDCTQLIENVKGIMLRNVAPGGIDERVQVFPTTKIRYYQIGQEVSWEWSFYNTWKDAWYIDPESNEKKLAWNSSAEFVGRHMSELGEK